MGGQKYSIEQLERLRDSPLVQKPDGLPAIEQWMEVPADQTNNNTNNMNSNRRVRPGNHGDGTTTGETRTERPALINMGSMGNFGRRASMQPEDTVLGPPKLAFASASRPTKAAENLEKRGIISIDGDHLSDRFPRRERGERWRDREVEGNRDKAGYTNGRRATREEGEGWQNVKGRKSLGQEDFDRGFGRNGDRDREKSHKDGDVDTDAPTRRGGTGRKDFDRWGRRDDANTKEGEGNKFGGATQGGWRDRERDRDRDRDRDWNRGASRVEEDPEWMDTGAGKDKKQAHTQEEFQRWKEQMRAKDTPVVEKEESKADTPTTIEPSIPTTISANPPSRSIATPSAVDASSGVFFGNWGKEKTGDVPINASETVTVKTKTVKSSRFMKMFEKPEEPAALSQPPIPAPASPGPAPPSATGSDDADKQGFQRILQMLGGTKISGQPAPQATPTPPINGTRTSGIPLELQQHSPPEERPESRPQRQPPPRTLEQQAMLEHILAPRPAGPDNRPSQPRFNALSPDNALLEQFGLPGTESDRPREGSPFQQPPPRNPSTQDAHLHALLNSRAREETTRDPAAKQRDFLLTLMQPSRATPPHMMGQNAPRVPENQPLPFFDQGMQRPQQQPKGRGGPPGFMEEPRYPSEAEMLRREQQLRELNMQQQEAMRAKTNRHPMDFNPPHNDPAIASIQRRNSEIPRQMTNMGIPSQPLPDMQFLGGRQPGMPPTPQERPNIAPPPGFGGPVGMRQPPGLGPNGPQQLPSFSAGNTPLGHPPGFGPPPGMRGAMFPGPGQNQMPPQGPPQGYFPPPGYGPPDPRMMGIGRPEFDQFGPGPRQPGRPPNMY